MKNVSFILWKKLNWLVGQPSMYVCMYVNMHCFQQEKITCNCTSKEPIQASGMWLFPGVFSLY